MRGPHPRNRLWTLGKAAVVLKMRIGAWSEAFSTRCQSSTKSWSCVSLKAASAPFRRPRWILQLCPLLDSPLSPFPISYLTAKQARLKVQFRCKPTSPCAKPDYQQPTPLDRYSRRTAQVDMSTSTQCENLKPGHDSCLLYLGFLSWVGTTFHDQLLRGSVCQALHSTVRFAITFRQHWATICSTLRHPALDCTMFGNH